MIAIDTSSLVAFLSGQAGADVGGVAQAFSFKHAFLPPVVLTEMLSDPKLQTSVQDLLRTLPTLEITAGYWERAGVTRAKVLQKGHKARIADALIAQACIDNNIPLITRDRDFRHFAVLCGLQLAY